MKKILFLLLILSQAGFAQKLKKADKQILQGLQTHIGFLADDRLEGRRTGSPGEKLAYEYITGVFEKNGLIPKGDNGTYIQEFDVNDGKAVNPSSHLIINGNDLELELEYFPFSFSPNASLQSTTSVSLQEKGSPWFHDLKEMIDANTNNPHFELVEGIKTYADDIARKGATALILFNTDTKDDELKFEPKAKGEQTKIPVVYIRKAAHDKFMKDITATLGLQLKVDISERWRKGHNVLGYIDNGAAHTIIVGAHYDHLGYGEDHNSLYAGKEKLIHNGADDNASGSAALLELARLLKKGKLKKNNYLFASFSGEELGLYGSKYLADHLPFDISQVNYMINMDMIGRLNDTSHRLNIGGYGTTPSWGKLLPKTDDYFSFNHDSAGTGPSDHNSFYRKDVPILFFHTGGHADYHKPTDDADKINYTGEMKVVKFIYGILESTNDTTKMVFTKTREVNTGKSSFKVTMGIMPDYTYSGTGVRVDGVSDGKPAQKAGLQAGDIILKIGEYKCDDLNGYMSALGKFKKGDATKVTIKRGTEELIKELVF